MDLWAYAAISSKLKPATYRVLIDPSPAQQAPAARADISPSSQQPAGGSVSGGAMAKPENNPVLDKTAETAGDKVVAASHEDISSQVVLGFLLGHYGFKRYKSPDPKDPTPGKAKLVWPTMCDRCVFRPLLLSCASGLPPNKLCGWLRVQESCCQYHSGQKICESSS